MRADRLLQILHFLQTQRVVSARELAKRLEVSERTVHRDMEALAAAGFPVYAERGPGGGWMLPEGYRSRLTGITSAEIAGLMVLQSSSAVGDLNLSASTDRALGKLVAALTGPARDEASFVRKHLHVDGAGWHDAREPAPYLGLVQQAVWERRKIRIRYPSGDEKDGAVCIVQPWGLVAKRHTWYFAALREYREPEGRPAAGDDTASANHTSDAPVLNNATKDDSDLEAAKYTSGPPGPNNATLADSNHAIANHTSDAAVLNNATNDDSDPAAAKIPEPRTYRVSRLAAVELLEERFEVPDAFDLARWWEQSVARFRRELPVYPVRLFVREEAWARFSREIYVRVKNVVDAADGWKETEAHFHTPDSALAILLGYGASIRVASPVSLARSVASEAKALLALYEGPDAAPQDQGHI